MGSLWSTVGQPLANHDTIGPLGHQDTLLPHGHPAGHQDPQVHLWGALFQRCRDKTYLEFLLMAATIRAVQPSRCLVFTSVPSCSNLDRRKMG